ncbi:hypothetical protein EV200_101457 [Pedobacter psychrotolerans]|uniref:Transposase n=1 Tax=Pedobacter psychrotolerans TaxID=1843235 RepID=A0A4R2HQF1_9SPHI|nr:hypothetical protein EV200_101457 [Pedobacter psychrotolerans]
MLKNVNTVIKIEIMKSIKISFSASEIIRRLGLAKIYYWFNK